MNEERKLKLDLLGMGFPVLAVKDALAMHSTHRDACVDFLITWVNGTTKQRAALSKKAKATANRAAKQASKQEKKAKKAKAKEAAATTAANTANANAIAATTATAAAAAAAELEVGIEGGPHVHLEPGTARRSTRTGVKSQGGSKSGEVLDATQTSSTAPSPKGGRKTGGFKPSKAGKKQPRSKRRGDGADGDGGDIEAKSESLAVEVAKDSGEDDGTPQFFPCTSCAGPTSELELLVCDGCEREVCLHCANLMAVPESDDPWFCPVCEEAIRRSRAVEVARAAEETKRKEAEDAAAKKKKTTTTKASKKSAEKSTAKQNSARSSQEASLADAPSDSSGGGPGRAW